MWRRGSPLLERKAIRRGVFQCVAALRYAIQRRLAAENDQRQPCSWGKAPNQVAATANRQVISVMGHWDYRHANIELPPNFVLTATAEEILEEVTRGRVAFARITS
jgi:hypothetical protein